MGLVCMTCIKIDLFECPRGVSECFCFARALSALMGLQVSCVALCANSRQQSAAVSRSSRKRESVVVKKKNFVKI